MRGQRQSRRQKFQCLDCEVSGATQRRSAFESGVEAFNHAADTGHEISEMRTEVIYWIASEYERRVRKRAVDRVGGQEDRWEGSPRIE